MSQSTIHSWFSTCPVRLDNIVWHWEQASRQEIERGMRWYADARHVATVIADGDAHLGAGMLAVYSPQQAWIGNVLLAARVLRAGQGLGGPGSGVFASTAQRRAADRLLAGQSYEDILTGPKVRDFAHLIEHGGDRDPATPRVVIDRHALSVACGRALTVAEYGAAPLKGYRRTAHFPLKGEANALSDYHRQVRRDARAPWVDPAPTRYAWRDPGGATRSETVRSPLPIPCS